MSTTVPDTIDIQKYYRFALASEEAGELIRVADRRLRDAYERVRDFEGRIRELKDGPAQYMEVRREHTASGNVVEHITQRQVPPEDLEALNRARAERDGAQARLDDLKTRWDSHRRLVTNLRDWLSAQGINAKKVPVYVPPRDRAVQGKAPRAEDLEAVRATITALKKEIKSVSAAAASQQEVFAAIDQMIETAAAGLAIGPAPMKGTPVELHFSFAIPSTDTDRQLMALAATIAPDGIRERLRARAIAAAEARGGFGPESPKRTAKLNDLHAQLFRAEVMEERLVESMEAFHVPAERRPDADPRAVLYKGPDTPPPPARVRRSAYLTESAIQ
jgi:hypothetical protein